MALEFQRWLLTQTNRLSCAIPVYTDKCMPRDADLNEMIVHAGEVHAASQDWYNDLWAAYGEFLELQKVRHG